MEKIVKTEKKDKILMFNNSNKIYIKKIRGKITQIISVRSVLLEKFISDEEDIRWHVVFYDINGNCIILNNPPINIGENMFNMLSKAFKNHIVFNEDNHFFFNEMSFLERSDDPIINLRDDHIVGFTDDGKLSICGITVSKNEIEKDETLKEFYKKVLEFKKAFFEKAYKIKDDKIIVSALSDYSDYNGVLFLLSSGRFFKYNSLKLFCNEKIKTANKAVKVSLNNIVFYGSDIFFNNNFIFKREDDSLRILNKYGSSLFLLQSFFNSKTITKFSNEAQLFLNLL